ncbi:pleckstrin homology domain-containing family G member 7 isoform X7 [Numida meleagris]|uniref:pleckstrin homology domain-containing family G member 7 isoform X7 n=1 Tax=Numida meleagris TaxID=8996 RepID=UPI000B3E0D1A|nr:pleckstrin homology domain-containing family G member 7 isoform X7 [Numida meleagris]
MLPIKMQQPSSDCSPDLEKETCINVDLLNKEIEPHKENGALSGSSSPEDTFSLCGTQPVSIHTDTTTPPGDHTRRRGYTESSLLKLPTEECTGSHHTAFQFDRHALARISTSPTLRRLRMASASQALTFQDSSDAAQLGNQTEYTGSLHHICKTPPRCTKSSSLSLPACVYTKLLYSKAKTETTLADPESANLRLKLLSQEDPLSNVTPKEMLQNSWRANSATLPRRFPRFSCVSQESIQSKSWHEFIKAQQTEQKDINSQLQVKKEEAVWELFTSECTYFLDHLLVLKMIFMNTLKYLQSNEFLLDVDLWRLFANLEELNKISLSFVENFFETVKEHVSESGSLTNFISVLRKFFQGDLCQTHQIYCLNYTSAVFYLEKLRQREDFGIYLKQWCEQKKQCRRLHLPELLVAPLHRLTRYPLLLNNIWKRSTDKTEKDSIWSLKEKVEKSIRDLEGKVKWLDNFQKFRQLHEVIIWPQVWDRDKRFFVPECLKQSLRENSSENILSSASRLLLHDGRLTLAESTRLLDVYLFLFDDFLLITKIKRNKKKYGGSDTGLTLVCPSLAPELQSFVREGGFCQVLDQPIPLDRLILKNVDPIHVTVPSLRNAFLIQHENRYRQCIAVFLLQAQTESAKKTWMSQIERAISNYMKQHETKKNTLLCSPAESSEI